jgi:SAM-dependent methyltransferase
MGPDIALRLDPEHLSVVAAHEDPRYAELIHGALAGAQSIVNVWAGTGAYEPAERYVVAIEPREQLALKRPPERAPAIRASPGSLPLHDASVDAAMAIRSVHEWGDERERGVREMRRVARGPVVILTLDGSVSAETWLQRDYLPGLTKLHSEMFPRIDEIVDWLGSEVGVRTVPVPRDSVDWPLSSMWSRPERLCEAGGRDHSRMLEVLPADELDHGLSKLGRDLADGTWDRRHGHLRALYDYDVGLRLIVGHRRA